MILLDTNVLIYASDPDSPFFHWARETISSAVAGDGAVANAVSVAEICVGDDDPSSVADRIRGWGVVVVDLPAAASVHCAEAYRRYRKRRSNAEGGRPAPVMPLPGFFIGAHAVLMNWELATADEGRFRTYFPSVRLLMPR